MRARRLCPDAVFLKPVFERYRAVSQQVRAIFLRHTPLVEPLSLDEAYLDVTEELTGLPTATAVAAAVRSEIREETQLTASAGVAPNKFLAKIASDWKKPDGLFVIRPHQVEAFLAPLPVARLPGVGAATEATLAAQGIRTVADVRRIERAELAKRWGKFGERLYELAHGIDEGAVVPDRPRKSISSETTFATDLPLDALTPTLAAQAAEIFAYAAKRGRRGRTVRVKLRTRDFRTLTRRYTPPAPPASGEEVLAVALELLQRVEAPPAALFRVAGVGLSNFLDEDPALPQSGLF
jgi:DNA polymerase-4